MADGVMRTHFRTCHLCEAMCGIAIDLEGNPVVHNHGAILFGQLFQRSLGSRSRYSATSVDQLPRMAPGRGQPAAWLGPPAGRRPSRRRDAPGSA